MWEWSIGEAATKQIKERKPYYEKAGRVVVRSSLCGFVLRRPLFRVSERKPSMVALHGSL